VVAAVPGEFDAWSAWWWGVHQVRHVVRAALRPCDLVDRAAQIVADRWWGIEQDDA
jgi:hypothetical protein